MSKELEPTPDGTPATESVAPTLADIMAMLQTINANITKYTEMVTESQAQATQLIRLLQTEKGTTE